MQKLHNAALWAAFVFLMVLVLLSPVRAQTGCISHDMAIAFLEEGRFSPWRILSGEELRRAGVFFNAAPPVTDVEIDFAAIAAHPPSGGGILIVGRGVLACDRIFTPSAERWRALLDAVEGRAL